MPGFEPQRILIVNPFGIGDVLFTTPLVRALRRAFRGSRVSYLCNRRTEGILRTNPHLDELFIYEKDELLRLWQTSRLRALRMLARLLGRIHRARFDLAIDLSLGERYGFILKLMGVPQRIGFDYRRRGRFLTERLSIDGYLDGHVVEYHKRLLRFMGVRLLESSLELHASEVDQRWAEDWLETRRLSAAELLVGIVPAGGVSWGVDAAFRRWGAESFAAVGDALAERLDACVLLFGEARDATICRTVAERMRHPTIDVSGQTTLGQFVALLARLSLVICNDGGPLHLAVSQGVKTVSIFGPVDAGVYGPYPADEAQHRVVRDEALPCRPCYHQFRLPPCPYERACLSTIQPSEVIEAAEALLKEHREQARERPKGA